MLNFAQGEIAMFTTFVAWNLFDVGLPWWASSIASLAIGFVVGAGLYRLLVVRLGGGAASPLAVVMVTIGLFLMLNDGAGVIWGTDAKPVPRVFGDGRVELFGAGIAVQVLGLLAVLGVLVIGVLVIGLLVIGLLVVASGGERRLVQHGRGHDRACRLA